MVKLPDEPVNPQQLFKPRFVVLPLDVTLQFVRLKKKDVDPAYDRAARLLERALQEGKGKTHVAVVRNGLFSIEPLESLP